MRLKESCHPYAFVTICFWALAFVFTRLGVRYFSVGALAFWRYLIAGGGYIVLALLRGIRPPELRDWHWFIIGGTLGFGIYTIIFNHAMQFVTVATSSLIIATVPIMTALLTALFYRERLFAYQWAAILVEFGGIVLMTTLSGGLAVNVGILWLLLGAVMFSCFNVIQRKLVRKYSAEQVSTYCILVGMLILFVYAPSGWREMQDVGLPGIVSVLILGVLSTTIAYICWARAFGLAAKTCYVTNYMFVTPILTVLLGIAVLGETPSYATFVGGAVILGGIMLFYSTDIREAMQRFSRAHTH